MSDCLFCKMVSGDIQPNVVYEDDEVLAFRDLNPQAPTHILVIPKRHISTLNDLESDDEALMGKMVLAAARIAEKEGIAEAGYRTLLNCNAEAGQTVFHIHLHLLGGRPMGWPPG
ncbi:MAG: histidine triad nucleotide-binding protein [gamma proteobacterium endosymbiont of Lamellibrachia anaximandri]|nr:histidine triad nucleotide-binding protein [gamma proteobacterium endosymbiont of Lamellibrachia anaximandri]MBL3534900.1 histidine triad nucleotide-binding protein [gamma proteobacterium endosymbiont of Lamellibrachia anaximandri]MBL3601369.1 histidine triad nucleotide-binding protein [gamma proteobacterium endosymbiont of Lamellibrachia anaximandri]